MAFPSLMTNNGPKKKYIPAEKPAKKDAPSPYLSTEYVHGSDLDKDENLDEVSSSDGEESLPENPTQSALQSSGKFVTSAAYSGATSGSDSGSAEDSESEEDEDEGPSRTPEKASNGAASAEGSSSEARMSSFKALPYIPPAGFEPIPVSGPSSASQLLLDPHLERKQIWYITAPASVPISSMKEVTSANIKEGRAVLSHHGHRYGIVQDSSENIGDIKVMVAKSGQDGYRTVSMPIDQILKVKEIVQLPTVYNASTRNCASSARPQPPGLRMRFRPIGFGKGKLGHIGFPTSADEKGTNSPSDSETADAPQRFRRPASLERDESSTSSDEESSSSSNAEMADAPPLISKLANKSNPQTPAVKDSSQLANSSSKRKTSSRDMKVKNSSSKSTSSAETLLKPYQETNKKFSGQKSISVN